jgi:beta-lactamase regulating signal transducer with metallopeptidase domain
MLQSCNWFHPLAWIAAHSLRQESERACDDSVLNCGIEVSEYAGQLLDLARTLENPSRDWSTALAIARPSYLERRLMAMLNPSIVLHAPLAPRNVVEIRAERA